MTRRDFERIAKVLSESGGTYVNRNDDDRVHPSEVFDDLAWRFAESLAETNPAFDPDRFMAAARASWLVQS